MLQILFTLLCLAADSTSLFDGKSLEGWFWSHDPNPPQPSWLAKDGILRTTPSEGQPVYLLTRDTFENFDFRFEWRAEPGANSGVKYRIQSWGNSTKRLEPTGLEYQLTDDISNPDALSTPRHAAGALYDYATPTKSRPARPNQWHQSRILVQGLHVEHWLDGERVIHLDLDSPEAAATFEQSPRQSRHALRKQAIRQSHIALQIHDGIVEFRNLSLTRLK